LSIFLDKENRCRAAAKRFKSERAASGEKIKDPCIDYRAAQTGKRSRLSRGPLSVEHRSSVLPGGRRRRLPAITLMVMGLALRWSV